MKILFLTQIVPYPPNAGPRVKTWHVIRALAEFGHNITLVTYIRPEEQLYLKPLEEICEAVLSVPIPRSRVTDSFYWLKSNWTGRPFLVERDDRRGMRSLISNLISQTTFDAIHADQLTMAQFAIPDDNPRKSGFDNTDEGWPMTVFDAHNAVWTIVRRMKENASTFLKPILSLEQNRIKRYEGKLIQLFDHTLTVIEEDRWALLEAASPYGKGMTPDVQVIPIAVDTEALQPLAPDQYSSNIMTLGTLHYPPNADGIRWFLNEVFPLIKQRKPHTSFTIIGKNPPSDFRLAADQDPESIHVTGFVPDLDPYYSESAVVVIPVRAGGGMRVRILESLARGAAVVTTTIGLEGINAQGNRHLLIADTVEDTASAVLRLLENPSLRKELGRNGRELIIHEYDWKVVLNKMQSIYPIE